MVFRCIVGICVASLLAAPIVGAEGGPKEAVQLSMFVEQPTAAPRHHEAAAQLKAKLKENLDYYDIDGTTASELRAQMKHNGTKWNDGKVYAALTTWDIRYHYDVKAVDGRFVPDNVSTSVDVDIHMPRLAASARTAGPLLAAWKSYETNLKTHEMGHRNIAVAIGEELNERLAALPSCDSKAELDRKAHALVREVFGKLQKEQLAYDDATHHGKLQGAVLQDPAVAGVGPGQGADQADAPDES